MTPREVVTRAIEFRRPARLGFENFGEASDVALIGLQSVRPTEAGDDPEVDEWLCRWTRPDRPDDIGQVTGHPLEDLSLMKDFPWPDANDARRYEDVPRQLAELAADPKRCDKYVRNSTLLFLWERMQALHGMTNCMIDLMDDRPEIHEMAERIVDYLIAVIRNLHRAAGDRIQGFRFSEDWGTQIDLQISPQLWDRFFYPRYQRLFKEIHDCGWHVWMHSCGRISLIVGRLIDAGVDLINSWQPRINDIEKLGRQYAGKVCFETLCDVQQTLPTGDRDAIAAEAELLLRSWGTPEGGIIIAGYGTELIDITQELEDFTLKTFRRLDPYRWGWNGTGGR